MPPPLPQDGWEASSAGYDGYHNQKSSLAQRDTSSNNHATNQNGHKRSASSQGFNTAKHQKVHGTRHNTRLEQDGLQQELSKCKDELERTKGDLQYHQKQNSGWEEDYKRLREKFNRLDVSSKELEKQYNKVVGQKNQLAEKLSHYRAVFDDKGKESAMLKSKLASIKNQPMQPHQGGPRHANQNQNVQNYRNTIEELKGVNAQLISKNSGLAKQLDETRNELMREISELKSKNSLNAKKISDTDIQRSWKHIGFLVRQFVDTYVAKVISPEYLQLLDEQGNLGGISSICAAPNAVLQCGATAPLVFQSMLWNFLILNVFDFEAEHWAGDLGKKFTHIFGRLSKHVIDTSGENKHSLMEALQEWRFRSVDLFCRLEVSINKDRRMSELATAMMREIAAFIPPSTEQQAQTMNQDAFDLIAAVAQLDMELRLSKAYYNVIFFNTTPPYFPCHFGYPFDATHMEQTSIGPRIPQHQDAVHPNLDLAISPGLIKAGNADGTHYHLDRVLVKMVVCCNINYFIGDLHANGNIDDGNDDVPIPPDGPPVKAEHEAHGDVYSLPSSPMTDVKRVKTTDRITYVIQDSSPIKAERSQEPDELSAAPPSHVTAVKSEPGSGSYNVQKVTSHGQEVDELANTYHATLPDSPRVKIEDDNGGGDIEMSDAPLQPQPAWSKDAKHKRRSA